MSYKYYDIPKDRYLELFPDYLRNEGTSFYNKVMFKYDQINEYKDRLVEFWKLFDLDELESLYVNWRIANDTVIETPILDEMNQPVLDEVGQPMIDIDYTPANDQDWIYTGFLENLCKSFNITREYYSYYANDPNNFTNVPNWKPQGNVLLNNLHMIRLLKVNRSGAGFDGTRESLELIVDRVFNNKKLQVGETVSIDFFIVTLTDLHASLAVSVIRPDPIHRFYWDEVDDYLVYDGKYFLELLGIDITFEAVSRDTLIYDSGRYVNAAATRVPQDKKYK